MAFNHRKLIPETVDESCPSYCDPRNNKDGLCPIRCINICYRICRDQILSPILPPPDYFTTPQDSDPHPNKHHKASVFLTISLSIFAVTFFLFFCYTAYRFYRGWYRSRQRSQPQQVQEETRDEFLDEDQGPVVDHPIWYIRTVGLQPSVISAITVCKYKRGEGIVEGTDCSVCLNEFQEDETLRLLPKCNHAFHIPCIDTWLRSHTNCPMCRAGIVINTAAFPSPEQIVNNSGIVEETHVGVNREIIREREDEACELRVGIEEEDGLQGGNGINSDENLKVLEVDEVFQPMRRSVSLDSLSASLISAAITNHHHVQSDGNSNAKLVNSNESNKCIVPKRVDVNQRSLGSPSIGGSGQKRPIKRSSSCSGKVLLSRNGRSRNSVLPPS